MQIKSWQIIFAGNIIQYYVSSSGIQCHIPVNSAYCVGMSGLVNIFTFVIGFIFIILFYFNKTCKLGVILNIILIPWLVSEIFWVLADRGTIENMNIPVVLIVSLLAADIYYFWKKA